MQAHSGGLSGVELVGDDTLPDISEALAKQLAPEIAAARLEGREADIEKLPAPKDMRMAELVRDYAAGIIQDALSTHVIGWKIGCSSERAMAALNVDEPFAGQLFDVLSHAGDTQVAVRVGGVNVPEPEFAFRMAFNLPPREEPYTEDDVAKAVDTVHPAIEVVDPRTPGGFGAPAPWLIADGAVSHFFVYGHGTGDWDAEALKSHRVVLSKNGDVVGEGTGVEALGGPLTALTWLVNHLRERGKTLHAREFVTTGIVTPIVGGVIGDRFEADFGALGKVEITYGA